MTYILHYKNRATKTYHYSLDVVVVEANQKVSGAYTALAALRAQRAPACLWAATIKRELRHGS